MQNRILAKRKKNRQNRRREKKSQIKGFEVAGKQDNIYRLKKALYRVRQTPRAWNAKVNQILCELKFQRCSKESLLYRKVEKKGFLIVVVYVDDLLVTDSSLSLIMEFKREMATKFEMSDLGKLTYCLGTEVYQYESGILLKQDRYAKKILEETGMSDCNSSHIPMDQNVKLLKYPKERSINEKEYRRNIGCLLVQIYFIMLDF